MHCLNPVRKMLKFVEQILKMKVKKPHTEYGLIHCVQPYRLFASGNYSKT